MIKSFKFSDNLFYNLTLLFVFFLFFSVFYLSYFKIINFWSFSQAHVNYSLGFVKRGLFGTIMLFFETNFKIKSENFFTFFFIIINSINIFLFFYLIKKFIQNKILFLFLALNPALILFGFNDLGGYQRLDAISIFLVLLHSYLASRIYNDEIRFSSYKNMWLLILLPFLTISILIHEIQFFSLLFHVIITFCLCKYKKVKSKIFYFYVLPFIIFFFLLNYGTLTKETTSILIKNLETTNIWPEPVMSVTNDNLTFGTLWHQITYMWLVPYNLRLNLFFFLVSILPLFLLHFFLYKNNFYKSKVIPTNYILIFILPLLAGFVLADLGRWINIMSFCIVSYISQMPLQKKLPFLSFKQQDYYILITNFLIIFFVFIYLFFIRIPHCCDLEKKNISIWGGVLKKITAIILVLKNEGLYLHEINLQKYKHFK